MTNHFDIVSDVLDDVLVLQGVSQDPLLEIIANHRHKDEMQLRVIEGSREST